VVVCERERFCSRVESESGKRRRVAARTVGTEEQRLVVPCSVSRIRAGIWR
jgi:hypothetical protein